MRWPRVRLRTKLQGVILAAAVVPLAVFAVVAARVTLASFERGVAETASRQLGVALNLVLDNVEATGDWLERTSEDPALVAVLAQPTPQLARVLEEQRHQMPRGVWQVFGPSGPARARLDNLEDEALAQALGVGDTAPLVEVGRQWGRRVTFARTGPHLVVRAVAPIVDRGLSLRGVAVFTQPLDGAFADRVKAALGTDVALTLDDEAWTTLRAVDGSRATLALTRGPDGTPIDVSEVTWRGHGFAVRHTALRDHAGEGVGGVGVLVDRAPVASARATAFRTLAIGGVVAVAFALALAAYLTRRIGRPIQRLHHGALAVARGDLDHPFEVPPGDEIADLAEAFTQMTQALRDNQARLAARVREIVAFHDAGRAISSVIELDAVVRKTATTITHTFEAHACAVFLVEPDGTLAVASVRGRRAGPQAVDELGDAAAVLRAIATATTRERRTVRIVRLRDSVYAAEVEREGGDGSVLGVRLERQGQAVGAIVLRRELSQRPFNEGDASLAAAFADQAATAIENARLYREVREASAELDRKVRLRTAELTAINTELGRTLADLRAAQDQLLLSERMAGLGLLVAGVAHEINSPTAAIAGAVDALEGALARGRTALERLVGQVGTGPALTAALAEVETWVSRRGQERPPTGVAARRAAREVRLVLAAQLPTAKALDTVAERLVEVGLTGDDAARWASHAQGRDEVLQPLTNYLVERAYVAKTGATIRYAVGQITRIVGSLKAYSHLDKGAARAPADLHEGLELTLTLLDVALRDTVVERRYGPLPLVEIYADELNQVWTNLIQNAAQAMAGQGVLAIETEVAQARPATEGEPLPAHVIVRIIDAGPGIDPEVMPHIFEPFFTTKHRGEGSGLGLGIVRTIIEKHGGSVRCESRPGRTAFIIALPLTGRPGARPPVPPPQDHGQPVSA